MSSGKIAFTTNSVLHILDLADQSVQRIEDGGRTAFPDWHPSGQQIASGLNNIVVYDLDSHNLVQTTQPEIVANYPAWHPSGRMMAYDVKQSAGDGLYFREFERNVDFSIPLPFSAFQVDWHPNGREIVFVGAKGSDKHIFKLDMGCIQTQDCLEQVQQLTTQGRYNHAPAWSPDGSMIAFEHYVEAEKRWAIMRMDADGKNLIRLSGKDGDDHHPTWGPDGWIAFQRKTPQGDRLFAMLADGSQVTQLTEVPGFEPDWWFPR